jgi:hypothetical protein
MDRRSARHPAAGQLLRRPGHTQPGRPDQGRARHATLVKDVMRILFAAVFLATLFGAAMPPALADRSATGPTLLEDFTMLPETRWRFFTDQVMGGMSTGGIGFAQEDGQSFARMTGRVSTANRGGFIQMRLDLVSPPPEGTTGVRLVVRGNTQCYFVHLRRGAPCCLGNTIRQGSRFRKAGKGGKGAVQRYVPFLMGVGRDQQI